MKCVMAVFFLLVTEFLLAQQNILVMGNTEPVCYQTDSIHIMTEKKLPDSLHLFDAIFVFSTAESVLLKEDIPRIEQYISEGGGVYCGFENWPLQAESQLLTMYLYTRECWGNFDQTYSKVENKASTNQVFSETDSFPAGKTTVAFPLDYRLKVEVWLNDQPLILSGTYGKGKVIIDGGYSRFYCKSITEETEKVFEEILRFLVVREQ